MFIEIIDTYQNLECCYRFDSREDIDSAIRMLLAFSHYDKGMILNDVLQIYIISRTGEKVKYSLESLVI